jgi:single-strand selective monofunctional uracil DNA glycosylase
VSSAGPLISSSRRLCRAVEGLSFGAPVERTYNPLRYARAAHEAYLRRWGAGRRRVLFLGMNPGPWGMAQTGVPFGEVAAVRDWLGIRAGVRRPEGEHPRRPVLGFDCPRSEVSGRRLWGLMRERFGTPERFFARHFVANYCPLLFLDAGGANLTPDRLRAAERGALLAACDAHLAELLELLQPEWGIGVGRFARQCLQRAAQGLSARAAARLRIGGIPHPSPASPAANRDWAGGALRALRELGVWE